MIGIVETLAIVIALIGGVPGIIELVGWLREKPKFIAHAVGLISSNMTIQGENYTLLVVQLYISNHGRAPLTPIFFELEAKHNKNKHKFISSLFPEELPNKRKHFKESNPSQSDLAKFQGSIMYGEFIAGHLSFFTQDISINQIHNQKNIKYQLSCIDIFKRKHTIRLHLPNEEEIENMVLPHIG